MGRFLDQYRSYMQIILVVAAVVSLAIKQWSTAGILVFLTVLNAVVGLRQEGKAESAMNPLKSMMKTTARVRRDGNESVIPAEELVVGDVVLLTAGDQVPADGRVVTASALQIDESALTGESTPAGKARGHGLRRRLGARGPDGYGVHALPGDPRQRDRAGHRHRRSHRGRADLRDAVDDRKGGVPAEQGDEHADIVDRLGGWFDDDRDVRARPLPGPRLGRSLRERRHLGHFGDPGSAADCHAGHPVAGERGASQTQRHREGPPFGRDVGVHLCHQLRQDRHAHHEPNDCCRGGGPGHHYTVSGTGYSLEGGIQRAAGTSATIEDAILPYLLANDAKLVEGKVVGDPTEGALLVLGHKAGLDTESTRQKFPRLATLPFDPTYKLMATFNSVVDQPEPPVVRCFVKGAAPAVMALASTALGGAGPSRGHPSWRNRLSERNGTNGGRRPDA